jgi:hypothetical protein
MGQVIAVDGPDTGPRRRPVTVFAGELPGNEDRIPSSRPFWLKTWVGASR